MRFERANDGAPGVGLGTTADLSRKVLRFRSEEPLEAGEALVLHIAWPELLQNVCSLELLVRGVVKQVTGRGALVSIASYEFRTCGARSFWEAAPGSSIAQVA